jgi:predicted naringenin-chalcone synthase
MTNLISIGTAVPDYSFQQQDIIPLMLKLYKLDKTESRKLSFQYRLSDIKKRHTIVKDYGNSNSDGWNFIPSNLENPFPNLEERMNIYNREALPLSLRAIENCLAETDIIPSDITHIISVSCTGMSAPGLDLQITEALNLPPDTYRTSVNFMGCYAAVHAMKQAWQICESSKKAANVLIVLTEFCSLHFHKDFSPDSASSALLFSDGCAAMLLSNSIKGNLGLQLRDFYSRVIYKGKKDMAWELSSQGFRITLSSYIPEILNEDIQSLTEYAFQHYGITKGKFTHFALHPGGKRILQALQNQLGLTDDQMKYSKHILAEYGNMSSPSVVFVLKEIINSISKGETANIFGIALGPGLTMESFFCSNE